MLVSEFDFSLPEELIAAHPVEPRDSARMLVVRQGSLEDKTFADVVDCLEPGDVLVANDAKVIPARLFGTNGAGRNEVLLLKRIHGDRWLTLIRNSRRLKAGDTVSFAPDFSAEILSRLDDGTVDVHFRTQDLFADLRRCGRMPLPPYIKRVDSERDARDYQTVYAVREGAVAAPTAGLHFTDGLLERVRRKGVKIAYVTLMVGGGTFLPVKAEDTRDHKMHSEFGVITAEAAAAVNAARRVIAVGTTSLRVLETAADNAGHVRPWSGETDIFITPGYRFKRADALITNFHLPRSTLFMLVGAFMGLDVMRAAYDHAIKRRYRFFSYGDATLLIPRRYGAPDASIAG